MLFVYYNDTKRLVRIHPATFRRGCISESNEPIRQGEQRVFQLPEGTIPWVKMWDDGELGLSILVSPMTVSVDTEDENNDKE